MLYQTYHMKFNHFLIAIMFFLSACRGKEGIEGKKSLIDLISESPGPNCSNGGYKVVSGIDQNGNNILDATEIQTSKFICNGLNGSNTLASLVQEPAGVNCTTGGYKLNTGVDLNNNNNLDPSEITNSQFICNGIAGNNSLVTLVKEPAGSSCSAGGYKVNTGVDVNSNGTLDVSEIQSTTYICNGNNGFNSLIAVKAEPAGPNCTYGGYSFNTGTDVNKNGILDNNEVTGTAYVCNSTSITEVRIPLDFSANTSSSAPVTGLALANFNKANYPGMDSIVVAARLYSASSNNNAIFNLVNLTDNSVINNSTLMSNKPFDQSAIQTSKNLYRDLPNKSINIGISLRSEIQGSFSAVYSTSYLILYKK
jgi:hypothetical protein